MPGTDDELARTATGPSAAGAEPAPALGGTLGRYRLETMLGEGGMGVVHAAFDPDLERRVALKVLRTLDGGGAARQRLLREARAMARVTHVNVVAVHEVGSAGGRDYVAMELIAGDTLDQWLRAAKRSQADVLSAFVAAGRGLAAAHAAGLVHRDFKPHNVLRQHDGRIVVTDFGLARGVESPGLAYDVTLKPNAAPVPLSEITATGSLLGTPAYMAPEQWSGGTIGPAADQFGFCVALWEALTGERPFRGATLDELQAEIRRGPGALDASKLPRRLRRALRRGLDPDPAKRWPSMEALLAVIARAERRPGVAAAIAASAAVAAAVLYLVLGHASSECDAPATDPAAVWTAERSTALARAGQGVAADSIDRDVQRWRETRARVCHADRPTREPELACLDAVLARLGVVARAAAAAHEPRVEAGDALIDPTVCEQARLPRIAAPTAELAAAMTPWLDATSAREPIEPAQGDDFVAKAGADPCASALAHGLAAGARNTTARQRHLDEADSAAQRCGDDRIGADVAILAARWALQGAYLDRDTATKVKRAEAMAANLPQRDLDAEIDLLRVEVATRADNLDEAIARADTAAAAFAARGRVRSQIIANVVGLALRELRGKPEELAQVPARLAEWRALAVGKLGADDECVSRIDYLTAEWTLASGDVAAAHAMFERLRKPQPNDKPVALTGKVVDAAGAPVAGAIVAAAPSLRGDSISVAIADTETGAHLRQAVTAADGTYKLPDAPSDGAIIAQHGNERSAPTATADGLTLVLAPTSRISGAVDLRGEPATNVTVVAYDKTKPIILGYELIAPVQRDGSFVLDGVPRGKIMLRTRVGRATAAVVAGTEVDVRDPEVAGLRLVVGTSKRVIHVIVRSTVGMPLANAQVIVLPGRVASTNAAQMNRNVQSATARLARQPDGEHAPPAVLAAVKPGDMYASMTEIPEGVVSACAIALPADLADPDLQKKILPHLDKIEVRCVPVERGDGVVVVVVPPFPRFD